MSKHGRWLTTARKGRLPMQPAARQALRDAIGQGMYAGDDLTPHIMRFREYLRAYGELDMVRELGLPINIQLLDLSTSMSIAATAVAREQGTMNGRVQAQAKPMVLWQLGFNSRCFPLHDCAYTDISNARELTEHELKHRASRMDGGLLARGSHISDALAVGIILGLAYREEGHTANMAVALLTDGGNAINTSDEDGGAQILANSEAACRKALESGRVREVPFHLTGFMGPRAAGVFTEFLSRIGVNKGEYSGPHVVKPGDRASLDSSSGLAFRDASTFLIRSLCQVPTPPANPT